MQKTIQLCALIVVLILPWGICPAHAAVHQFYNASLELSDSRPLTPNDWTLDMVNVQPSPPGGQIVITPQAGEFTIPVGMDFHDLDLFTGTDQTLAAAPGTGAGSAWGVNVVNGTSGTITLINNDTDTITGDTRIIVHIGKNAVIGSVGTHQISNPLKQNNVGSADIWRVDVSSKTGGGGDIDSIVLLVATIEHVNFYAGPMPHMTFDITAITPPAGGTIAANYIDWRGLTALTPKTATLRVKVNTDAQNGFTVYIRQDHNMLHDQDPTIDIDPIKNVTVGTNDSPVIWAAPTGTVIGVDTGFLGYTTTDTTLNNVGDGINRFATGTKYAGLTSASTPVLFHDHATQSNLEGQDFADVTFQIEVNNLQPTGNYANDIIFIAKPIF